jgi:DNA-binding transcriptional MerR regulator
MRTTDLATAAGVNPQTLRYYERRGLLPEPERTSSGYRRAYGGNALAVVRFIKRAQRLGFTLSDVEALLDLADGGPDSCEGARALAGERIDDLDDRISELEAMRAALARLVATCDQPRTDRKCPLLGALVLAPDSNREAQP